MAIEMVGFIDWGFLVFFDCFLVLRLTIFGVACMF
jgi:hypothetical protein